MGGREMGWTWMFWNKGVEVADLRRKMDEVRYLASLERRWGRLFGRSGFRSEEGMGKRRLARLMVLVRWDMARRIVRRCRWALGSSVEDPFHARRRVTRLVACWRNAPTSDVCLVL